MKKIYNSLLALALVFSVVSCSKENIQPNAYKNAVHNNTPLAEVNPQTPVPPACPHECHDSPCGSDVR